MAFVTISQVCGVLVDMWTTIISWFNSTIGNYAWSIILLTLAIKVLLLPLDFFNKKISRKNAKMQAVIQPELNKLQQKYANDKNMYNQKVTEVYKSHNYNVVGSCLFMIVNLAVTLTVFITLFSGLNNMASKKIIEQYTTLQTTYQTAYSTAETQGAASGLSGDDLTNYCITFANQNVQEQYLEIKQEYTWLWIDNVWKADLPQNSIPTASEYLKIAKQVIIDEQSYETSKLTDEQKQIFSDEYEIVMGPLRESVGKTNGYLILAVLILGTAFLTQWLSQRKNKSAAGDPAASSGKIMMFVLPIMLGFFALSYNAVFALYLLTSQLITLASTPVCDLLIDKLETREQNKKQVVAVAEYSRNYDKNKDKKKENKDKNQK